MSSFETAKAFWEAFDYFQHDPMADTLFPVSVERLRFQCLIGFTALDATLTLFWQHQILPEWNEILTLSDILVNDDSVLNEYLQMTEHDLKKAQWVASLRFLANTGEPEKFSPTFTDIGIILLLCGGSRLKDPNYIELTNSLFRMQKYRNSCIHTGREFNELAGFEAIKLLEKFMKHGQRFSPFFTKHPEHLVKKHEQKRAA